MKSLIALVAVLLLPGAPAAGEPRGMSQNPRAGLLAELPFQPGSTRLPDASRSKLGRIAAWADENWDGLVVVDAHADRAGPQASNLRISLRRARLVRDQLVALGVEPSQIVVGALEPDGRHRGDVAIWGTHNSLEQVLAVRRGLHRAIVVPPYDHRPGHSPTLMGSR
jgi:hypothetical protein